METIVSIGFVIGGLLSLAGLYNLVTQIENRDTYNDLNNENE